ncbi:hypothetical protein [Bifidobacterium myosotis]|uniref:Uncharacterized protein n=1 Tax=Bifidobacterium myosotis TaxID=1630166 RepID=A0A5M9ZL19_9BIFI|nr:hypothetical protein [Bifidobacterium myosotis]KAA8828205.1 hypothetical protein EMO91_07145 [Bifidobacterium myosotis]
MSMFDGNNGWPTFGQDPQPEPQPAYAQPEQPAYDAQPAPEQPAAEYAQPETPAAEPEPAATEAAEAETQTEAAPEQPAGDAGQAAPEADDAKPEAESKTERKPARPRPEFAWTADRVRKVREALAALDDERTRRVVAAIAGGDPDDVDRLALQVLKGSLAGPIGLLVAWHDEPDGMRRAIAIGGDQERDAQAVRKAARVAVVIDPALEGTVKPTGSKPTELQYALATAAPDLDVDSVRGLA